MISSEHRQMLADVASRLENGELHHVVGDAKRIMPNAFNMGVWECGSCACIGGWVERLHGVDLEGFSRNDPGLHELFYVDDYAGTLAASKTETMAAITASQAARAVRNYLDCGAPKWADVLQSDGIAKAPSDV